MISGGIKHGSRLVRRHGALVSILALFAATASCGPDLNILPGATGNIDGAWYGKGSIDGVSLKVAFWFEQQDAQVYGAFAQVLADYYAYSAGVQAICNVGEGRFDDQVLTFTVPVPFASNYNLRVNLGYRPKEERLSGKWGVQTDLADISGTLELKRIAWLPLRGSSLPLGCAKRPLPQCADGLDNDNDGLIDSKDPSCCWYGNPLPLGHDESADPTCIDRIDNDNDNLEDELDPDCAKSGGKESLPPDFRPHCSDGVDNDKDGLVDLKDPGCQNNPMRHIEVPPICADGVDNDGDKLIDAKDPHCSSPGDAREAPACSDGADNDWDGFFDLADPQCQGPGDDSER